MGMYTNPFWTHQRPNTCAGVPGKGGRKGERERGRLQEDFISASRYNSSEKKKKGEREEERERERERERGREDIKWISCNTSRYK